MDVESHRYMSLSNINKNNICVIISENCGGKWWYEVILLVSSIISYSMQ